MIHQPQTTVYKNCTIENVTPINYNNSKKNLIEIDLIILLSFLKFISKNIILYVTVIYQNTIFLNNPYFTCNI